MSKVWKCVESSRNWFRVKYINDFKNKQDKPLYDEKSTRRHGYSYKQRKKPDRDNKQIVAK